MRSTTPRLLSRSALLLAFALAACSTEADVSSVAQPSLTGPTLVLANTGFGDPGVTTSTPPSDMPGGSVAWCCGTTAWWLPLPAVAGDTVSSISVQVEDNGSLNGAVTGGSGGNNIMVSLFARPTGGGADTPIGPVTAYATSDGTGHLQTLAFTLPTPYQVPTGVTVLLRALASSAYPYTPTRPSAIGPVLVSPFVPPPPPPFVGHVFYHVASGAGIISAGITPNAFSTSLFVGPSTTAMYPLTGLSSQWTVTAIRVFVGATPTGNPEYDLVADSLSSLGYSGVSRVHNAVADSPSDMVDIAVSPGIAVAAPLLLRITTDAHSATSVAAVRVDYTM